MKRYRIEEGMIIETPSLTLKVAEARGKWVRVEYWDDTNKAWKKRGYTEARQKVERNLESGLWAVK